MSLSRIQHIVTFVGLIITAHSTQATLLYASTPSHHNNYQRKTSLHLAVKREPRWLVACLLANFRVNPNARDSYGRTPLFEAVWYNKRLVAHDLIMHGACPNSADGDGNTPLHLAVNKSNKAMVAMLLYHAASPNQQNHRGETPLHTAARRGNPAIVSQLLQAGANPLIENRERNLPSAIAYQGQNELAKYLIIRRIVYLQKNGQQQ